MQKLKWMKPGLQIYSSYFLSSHRFCRDPGTEGTRKAWTGYPAFYYLIFALIFGVQSDIQFIIRVLPDIRHFNVHFQLDNQFLVGYRTGYLVSGRICDKLCPGLSKYLVSGRIFDKLFGRIFASYQVASRMLNSVFGYSQISDKIYRIRPSIMEGYPVNVSGLKSIYCDVPFSLATLTVRRGLFSLQRFLPTFEHFALK